MHRSEDSVETTTTAASSTDSVRSSLSQPTNGAAKWFVNVDAIGAFSPTGTPCSPYPVRDGNFRLTVGDTLIVQVPGGSLVNQKDVRLTVIDGVGDESVLIGTPDALDNLRFEWVAPETAAGPCAFNFDYIPFDVAPSATGPSDAPPIVPSYPSPLRRASNDFFLRRQSSILEPGVSKRHVGVVNRVIVAPRIVINRKLMPVESLSMQTVMSRCVGTLDTWTERLRRPASDLNYNVIHFTPVQVTGESGSCYSLADQLSIARELLPPGSKSTGWDALKGVVKELESRYGLMSTSDIVLNHTANNTHWIPHHPECGYNERNSPHLKAAIDLDIALQEFSLSVAEGQFRSDGLSEVIEDEGALKNLRRIVQQQVLNPFNMVEWFEIDMERAVNEFRNATSKSVFSEKSDGELRGLLKEECLNTVGVGRKKGVCPNGEVASRLCRDDNHYRSLLRQVQEDLRRQSGEVVYQVLDAIEGYVRWERLQCRKGPVGKTHWNALIPRYFTPVVTKSGDTLHLANNGWVMDWDAERDFAAPGSLVYLSRAVVAWSDCIKLRYGDGPEDCPFLWNFMKDYCVKTAQTFHGIRLDNCHSTPIHVAKYCLTESRKINPALWVYAELFTGKRETDLKFERELGLNALIREAMQSFNGGNLAHHIKEFGGRPVGALDTVPALLRFAALDAAPGLHGAADAPRPLIPKASPSLFFDCTHDNETPHQRRTAIDALPNAAAVASCVSAMGSCRGYDELVPRVLSVVTERRLYYSYLPEAPSAEREEQQTNNASKMRFKTSLRAQSSSMAVKGAWDGWKDPIELTHHHGVWTGDLPVQYHPKTEKDFVSYQVRIA